MKRSIRILTVLAVSMVGACAWWMAGRPGATPRDQITFNHAFHLEQGAECDTCHAGIKEAKDASVGHLPGMDTCGTCHDVNDNCTMCHSDPDNADGWHQQRPALGFSHEAHMERTGEDCSTCHEGIKEATELPIKLPKMETCFQCHNHELEYKEARCMPCHTELRAMPLKAVAEFDHSGDWMKRHGMMARVQGAQCTQCHAQSMCAECHSKTAPMIASRLKPEEVGRAFIHRGDWISAHPFEARADGAMCLRCHQTNYCASCHKASGVSPKTGENGRSPHPTGYATSPEHGRDARLHVETCAACHDQGAATVCIRCHEVGSPGGNPHPAGWGKTHDEGDASHETPCVYCHTH